MLHQQFFVRVHFLRGVELFHIGLMTGKVPFPHTLVVILEDHVVYVGDFVSLKVHRRDDVHGLAIIANLHHALFFENVRDGQGVGILVNLEVN